MNRRYSRALDLAIGVPGLLGRALGRSGHPLVHLSAGLRYRSGLERPPRILVPSPRMAQGTRSSRNINELLVGHTSPTYLEIGVFDGTTLEAVRARSSTGVDPAPMIREGVAMPRGIELHRMTSDAYFAALDARRTFDAVFVDGLHEFGQAYRDTANALTRLRPGGFVLIDDVVPADTRAAGETIPASGPWMGDVFRAVLALSHHTAQLDWRTFERPAERFQTLVQQTSLWTGPVEESVLEALAGTAYEDVFRDGVPAAFRPATFDEARRAYFAARRRD